MQQMFNSFNRGQFGSAAPASIYSPQQTRQATNQNVADAYSNNNYYEASKRFMGPGKSLGASAWRSAVPLTVAGRVGAAQATAETPFGDATANARQYLGQQTAADAESLGWGSLGLGQQANNMNNYTQRQGMAWSLLNQILGS